MFGKKLFQSVSFKKEATLEANTCKSIDTICNKYVHVCG